MIWCVIDGFKTELDALESAWKHTRMIWKRHSREEFVTGNCSACEKSLFNFIDKDAVSIHWDIDTVRDA